jgi:hypothetical protein
MKLTIKQREAIQYCHKMVKDQLLKQRVELSETKAYLKRNQDIWHKGIISLLSESLIDSEAEEQKTKEILGQLTKMIGE